MGEPVRRPDHERVEHVLRVQPRLGGRSRPLLDGGRRGLVGLPQGEDDPPLLAGDVAHGRADQPEEVALDPLAREVVRDADDERVVVEPAPHRVREPGAVGGAVERPLEPAGYLAPQGLCRQLDGRLHAASSTPSGREKGEHTSGSPQCKKCLICRHFPDST